MLWVIFNIHVDLSMMLTVESRKCRPETRFAYSSIWYRHENVQNTIRTNPAPYHSIQDHFDPRLDVLTEKKDSLTGLTLPTKSQGPHVSSVVVHHVTNAWCPATED